MDTLSVMLGAIPTISSLVSIIVIIRKSGSAAGSTQNTLQNINTNVVEMKADVSEVKNDITDIKIRNAAADARGLEDHQCVQEMKQKVETHGVAINNLQGKMDLIADKLVIAPKCK